MNWPENFGPLEIAEAKIIIETLKHFGGNRTYTAKALRCSYRFLTYKVKQYKSLLILPNIQNTPEK